MTKIDYSLHYKKWHNESVEHFDNYSKYYQRILEKYLPEDKTSKILDVGCGFGLAIYALIKMGYKNVQGIDISPEQIKIAKEKGLAVQCVADSIIWLNNHKEEFDLIITLDVLEHLPVENQIDFTVAISNAIKGNGKFICTVPNASSTYASRWRYIDWTHSSSFSEHSLEFVLLNSHFKSIKIHEIEFMVRPKYPYFPRRSVLSWYLFKLIRGFRRLEAIAEMGQEGRNIPLSLNIIGIAMK